MKTKILALATGLMTATALASVPAAWATSGTAPYRTISSAYSLRVRGMVAP